MEGGRRRRERREERAHSEIERENENV